MHVVSCTSVSADNARTAYPYATALCAWRCGARGKCCCSCITVWSLSPHLACGCFDLQSTWAIQPAHDLPVWCCLADLPWWILAEWCPG